MRIVIGLFKVNTQATQNLSAATRVDNVRAAVEWTRQYTESLGTAFWKSENQGLRAIFLAPEYCFARSLPKGHGDHTFGDKRQMEEDYVKSKLRPVFGEISQNFRNALIVPGTVAWRKSIQPAGNGDCEAIEEATEERRDKYRKRIDNAASVGVDEGQKFRSYTPVFPAAARRPDDPSKDIPTSKSKSDALKTAHYIAKNTAHCYYNGKCIYKYNKIGDYYEVFDDNKDTVMVPNRSTVSGTTVGAGRFQVDGIPLGISICYDQSLSMQVKKNAYSDVIREPLQKTEDPVVFHLLLSAHIAPYVSQANLVNGGLLVSCSSNESCNGILLQDGSRLTRDSTRDINGTHGLDLYRLEFD